MLRRIEVSADDSDGEAGPIASQQIIAVAGPRGRQVCSFRQKFCKLIGSQPPPQELTLPWELLNPPRDWKGE